MLRRLPVLVAALALASCSGALSQEDCEKAAEAGTWEVTFVKASGPETCPTLEAKSMSLPDRGEENCQVTESGVAFTPAPNSATVDSCAIRFHELCPTYSLDCQDVQVASATAASGICFYKAGSDSCGYSVSWTKQ